MTENYSVESFRSVTNVILIVHTKSNTTPNFSSVKLMLIHLWTLSINISIRAAYGWGRSLNVDFFSLGFMTLSFLFRAGLLYISLSSGYSTCVHRKHYWIDHLFTYQMQPFTSCARRESASSGKEVNLPGQPADSPNFFDALAWQCEWKAYFGIIWIILRTKFPYWHSFQFKLSNVSNIFPYFFFNS